ncbi:NUDIX domain-containing protein [Kaarinaea lacus]
MSIHSAGILLYRLKNDKLEVMLVHPGGPYWAKKDESAWSIPKGLVEENEPPLEAAKREFKEETGFAVAGDFVELGALRQPSKKIVHAWALKQDLDSTKIVSNTFELEWPKNSGVIKKYPEIDRAGWFGIAEAKQKILKGQQEFLNILANLVNVDPND